MQSEEMSNIEKKIIEAADNHFPVYDATAWEKMELLLNRHLPQKKDKRRRIIFFLFLFLMLGGGAYLFFNQPWKFQKSIAKDEKYGNHQPHVVKDLSGKSEHEIGTHNSHLIAEDQYGIKRPAAEFENNFKNKQLNREPYKVASQEMIIEEMKEGNDLLKPELSSRENKFRGTELKEMEREKEAGQTVEIEKPDRDEPGKIVKGQVNDNIFQIVIHKTDSLIAKVANPDETVINQKENGEKHINKKAGINKREQSIALSLSSGPDISNVSSGGTGKVTFSYGAGISYTRNRFTMRSGFYIAKKIYTAGPDSYKLSYTLPPTVKLISVDADCRVYEIPLGIVYNFRPVNNGNMYAGLGLSSYIMKKEDYTYYYKNTYGQYYKRDYKYKNKNEHFFSVLNLSGGYNYRLNKSISIFAEAYLKIPFEGIGVGKVRLNSAGLLFSLGFHPFRSSKTTRKPAERLSEE